MTDRVKRPHKKPGPQRLYARDTLSTTKRGRAASKKIQKIRVAALRKKSVSAQTLKQIEKSNQDRPLTTQQLQFVRFWAQGETPRTAVTMAGYSEGSASIAWKMSRDPAMLKLYHIEKKLYEEAAQMTRKRVMDMLIESYDCAKLVSEPSSMVAAAREIGKMCGYYEPEVKINVHIGGKLADKLNSLTDDQLLELMNQSGDTIIGEAVHLTDDAQVPQLEHAR